MSSFALLERGAARSRDGVFLVSEAASIGYRDAIVLVRRIANALLADGFQRGDHAAVLSPNDPHAFIAALGAQAAGMTYLPANPNASPAEIGNALARFDCSTLFYHADLEAIVGQLRHKLPKVRRFISIGGGGRDVDLASYIAEAGENSPAATPMLEDIAYLAQTGGTTGEPKGVMIGWGAITAFVTKFLSELPDPAPVLLAATPMTHAAGIVALPIMAAGGRIVVMKRPDLARFVDLVESQKVTVTFLPPTVIYRLLDMPGIEKRDFSHLRYFIYGAAPMSLARLKQALAVFGPVMTQFYGQTECHSMIAVMRPEDHFTGGARGGQIAADDRLSACGRPSIGTTVVIKDDDGRTLGPGERGEICVHSDLMMAGYYKNPAATAETIRGGFVHTGDIGLIDAEGFLHIVDRKKDMIISGGFNVYPAEVEEVLRSHNAVAECAVIGVPHPDWGEAVVAAVELKPGATLDAQTLTAFARERLGGVKTPKTIEFWRALPRSAIGKVLKKEVKAAWGQMGKPEEL
jgi:acyl-CoA synthetase (AMP-forming)/AMP-acid ligase II